METLFWEKQIVLKSNWFLNFAYLYISLPFCIFLLGWCKFYIALPGVVILLICYYNLCRDRNNSSFWAVKLDINSFRVLGLIFIIICVWVYFSGIGHFVYQSGDHYWRNVIYELLVQSKWPVSMEMELGESVGDRQLIYYIGFWLPSAVIGKLFGLTAGYSFQAVWAILGICLFYSLICIIRQKLSIWPLLLFIGFSGLDIVGRFWKEGISALFSIISINHIEWWVGMQFSSFTTQLFWVFNQALPAWIIIMLMYLQKKNRYLVLFLGLSMLFSTLPFIGMIPFVGYFCLIRIYEKEKRFSKQWWIVFFKDTFSFENVIGGGITGILSFLYLSGNDAGQEIGIVDWSLSWLKDAYIGFIFLEVGIYAFLIYKYQKTNSLYYATICILILCPWIRVGYGADFCMRASIPALVILYLLICQTLEICYKKKAFRRMAVLILVLMIGFITPLHEVLRSVYATRYANISYSAPEQAKVTEEEIMGGANFSGDTEENYFYQYFAK